MFFFQKLSSLPNDDGEKLVIFLNNNGKMYNMMTSTSIIVMNNLLRLDKRNKL